jgi:hypothetical protein
MRQTFDKLQQKLQGRIKAVLHFVKHSSICAGLPVKLIKLVLILVSLRPCNTEVKQNIIGMWNSVLFRFLAQKPKRSSFCIRIRSVNKLRPNQPGACRRSLQVTSAD